MFIGLYTGPLLSFDCCKSSKVVKDTYLNEKDIKFALLMVKFEPILYLIVLIIGIDWNKSL